MRLFKKNRYVYAPATEADLRAAGHDPDDWRGHDGEILADEACGPPEEGVMSVPADELDD